MSFQTELAESSAIKALGRYDLGRVRAQALHVWRRSGLAGSLHCLALVAAFAAAVSIRFDLQPPAWVANHFWPTLLSVVAIQMAVFGLCGQFKAWWGHVAFRDLMSLTRAALCSLICLTLANHAGLLPMFVPRLILLTDFAATILFVGALRSICRGGAEVVRPWLDRRAYRPALLLGAGAADKILSLHLQSHPELPFRIRGFLDKPPCWPGQSFGGVPVLGRIDQLLEVARRRRVADVIAITGSLPGRDLRRLRAECEAANIALHVLPPLNQLVNSHKLLTIKPLDVESLLRRDSVQLDDQTVSAAVRGAVVLVTGAGGSIGSEICRQVLQFEPRALVIVDRSEPSLFSIDRELRAVSSQTSIATCLGDVTDAARMRAIFRDTRPEVVFHVAAHKHVPLLESHASEAVKNNIFGTAALADLAHEFAVDRFVYISTDKAVNPSSVMGVTKHVAESYVLALSERSATRFMAVRFGNVLASAGSVVPIFYEQIRHGGPITITHPEIKRFFMTIAEASQLVLQAAGLAQGGQIFVLDMGEPVLIVDLAKEMIRAAGLPEHAIDIVFVGMRPGEKMFEELYFADEEQQKTPHPKLFAAGHRPIAFSAMRARLDELKQLVDRDERRLIDKLREIVPEYAPPGADAAQQGAPSAAAHARSSGGVARHEPVAVIPNHRVDELRTGCATPETTPVASPGRHG